MSILSQIRSDDRQRHGLGKASSVETLVSALRQTELALHEGIVAEEERTRLRDPDDPSYSMLARSMRERLDNLRMTIATLDRACAA